MNNENKEILDRYTRMTEEKLTLCFTRTETVKNVHMRRLSEAMEYSLMSGGKRLRPALVLGFCRLCGGNEEDALAAAAAIEMIHTFSLIHDDLPCMDNDDTRRGKPSCHKAYGEALALLAGDALENYAFGVIADDGALTAEKKAALISVLSEATGHFGMTGGQAIDIRNVDGAVLSEEELSELYSLKTSALIACACKMGCICAGRNDIADKAAEYGKYAGLAFQIADDILDIVSNDKDLGKTTGSDSALGKSTFASVFGLDRSRKTAAEYAEKAKKAIDGIGDTGFLSELADIMADRRK